MTMARGGGYRTDGTGNTARLRQLAALQSVGDETRKLFHRLKAVAETVHGQGETSAGRRGILLDLARHGAHTVPQLARARPVSRQHIQTLVNALRTDRYVELIDNPAPPPPPPPPPPPH